MLTTLLAAIPQPPVDSVMPKTAESIFNAFIFIPLGIALAIAVRKIVKGKGPLLLYCLIGGALAAGMEPIVDVLGLVYLKENGALGTFTVLGRTMPLYICFVYPWYVGGLGYLAYKLFQLGVTMKNLFALWALDCVVDILLETPGILAHTYLYYGHQPLNPWGFPLWWGFVNPVMPMLAGALIYHLLPHLTTWWKQLAVIACIPMADGIANGATAFPMWWALNQDNVSYVWTYIACLTTLGLALFSVWIIGLSVVRPEADIMPGTLRQKLAALVWPSSSTDAPPPVSATHASA
jgi:hypothetical protein